MPSKTLVYPIFRIHETQNSYNVNSDISILLERLKDNI